MIKIESTERHHLDMIEDHGRQEEYRELILQMDGLVECIESGVSKAVVDTDEQKVIGIGGVVEVHPYRGVAWAVLPTTHTKNFIYIHRTAIQIFEECKYPRIEAHVDPEFQEAVRWIQMLGFHCECERMSSFMPDGKDASLYALLR